MIKNKFITIQLFIFVFVVIGRSQTMPPTYSETSYGQLEYGLYVPENYNKANKYPLLMFLHGFGNNYTTYLNWYDSLFQSKNPCFVFTPKTPPSWADWSGWNDNHLSEPMLASIHVLDSLMKVYSIDTNRLYIYGISMGGEGVFDLLHKLPGKFAAAMSVCGGGQEWWADNISKTPFWMFHGGADEVNPPYLTERVYNKLLKIGAKKMRYTNYPGYGHGIWDKAASEPAWNDWMFSFSKNDTVCPKPDETIKLTAKTNDKIELSWNDIRNSNYKANNIWYYKILNHNSMLAAVEFNTTSYSFKPITQIDTFKISAVNVCFANSNFSNTVVYFNNNTGIGSTSIGNQNEISINCLKNKIVVEGFKKSDTSTISVELVSLEGKVLIQKVFKNQDNISIDLNTKLPSVYLINVKYNDRKISKKIATN